MSPKRLYLGIIVALALACGLLAARPARAAQPGVAIDSLTLAVGAQGTATFQASDIPAPGLGAWLIDVAYSSTTASAASCTPVEQLAVCNNTFADGVVRLAGVNSQGVQGTFTLATIDFHCDSTGLSNLTVTVRQFVDTGFVNIPATVHSGTITCGTPVLLGDVNCDHSVTAVDAALVLQYSAQLLSGLACQSAGDVNGDHAVNPVDAAIILQYAAGLIAHL